MAMASQSRDKTGAFGSLRPWSRDDSLRCVKPGASKKRRTPAAHSEQRLHFRIGDQTLAPKAQVVRQAEPGVNDEDRYESLRREARELKQAERRAKNALAQQAEHRAYREKQISYLSSFDETDPPTRVASHELERIRQMIVGDGPFAGMTSRTPGANHQVRELGGRWDPELMMTCAPTFSELVALSSARDESTGEPLWYLAMTSTAESADLVAREVTRLRDYRSGRAAGGPSSASHASSDATSGKKRANSSEGDATTLAPENTHRLLATRPANSPEDLRHLKALRVDEELATTIDRLGEKPLGPRVGVSPALRVRRAFVHGILDPLHARAEWHRAQQVGTVSAVQNMLQRLQLVGSAICREERDRWRDDVELRPHLQAIQSHTGHHRRRNGSPTCEYDDDVIRFRSIESD